MGCIAKKSPSPKYYANLGMQLYIMCFGHRGVTECSRNVGLVFGFFTIIPNASNMVDKKKVA